MDKLILFAGGFLVFTSSAFAENASPAEKVKFEKSPFVGVCEDSALLPAKAYKKDKEYWDYATLQCGAKVEVMPDTGFFSSMMGVMGSMRLDDEEKQKAVAFLRKVGARTIDNIDYNIKQTERQQMCADPQGNAAWFKAKLEMAAKLADKNAEAANGEREFYNPAVCDKVIHDLKEAVATKGADFRVEMEAMKHTAGAGSTIAALLRKLTGQKYPGEKVELAPGEKERLATIDKEIDAKVQLGIQESMDSNLEKYKKLKEKIGDPFALQDPSIERWFKTWYIESNHGANLSAPQAKLAMNNEKLIRKQKEFTPHYQAFTKALGGAPIVAYLDKREPSNQDLAAAAAKLIDNMKSTKAETEKLLKKNSGAVSSKRSETEQDKINNLMELLKNGEVVKSILKENPSDCSSAIGALNYMNHQEAITSGAAVVGLLGASILAPEVVGPVGAFVGVGSVGLTVTGTGLVTAMGVAAGGYTLYNDYESAKEGEKHVLIYSHNVEGLEGAGRAIADTNELLDSRNALAINLAIQAASIAAPGGMSLYKSYFAENQGKYQTGAVLRQLMKPKANGGGGLTENQATALLKQAADQDGRVASEALTKVHGLLGGDPEELLMYQKLAKKQMLDPEMKDIFEPFSKRLQALRKTPGGEEKAKQLLARADQFIGEFAPNELNPAKRADALKLMVASSQFDPEEGATVIMAAKNAKDWPEGVGGLARAYDQAREAMLLPEIQKLAPEARRQAAMEKALTNLGVRDQASIKAMSACALGKK